MSFIELLPFDIQNELVPFLGLTPKELEEYPFKKNHRETHRTYFKVVLDELLLMTSIIKSDLNQLEEYGNLKIIAVSHQINLDNGQVILFTTNYDAECLFATVPRWKIGTRYDVGDVSIILCKLARSMLCGSIILSCDYRCSFLQWKLKYLQTKMIRRFAPLNSLREMVSSNKSK